MTTSAESSSILNEVRSHIQDTMLIGLSDQSIEPDESLLERGVIDSTGVLELVEYLESRYGIEIADGDITTDNLDSLNAITTYVLRKLQLDASQADVHALSPEVSHN